MRRPAGRSARVLHAPVVGEVSATWQRLLVSNNPQASCCSHRCSAATAALQPPLTAALESSRIALASSLGRSKEAFLHCLGRISASTNAVLESAPAISAKCGGGMGGGMGGAPLGGACSTAAAIASAPAMPAAMREAAPAPASAASLPGGRLHVASSAGHASNVAGAGQPSEKGGACYAAAGKLASSRGVAACRGLVASRSAAAGLLSASPRSQQLGSKQQAAAGGISVLQPPMHKGALVRESSITNGSAILSGPGQGLPKGLPQVAGSPSRAAVSQQMLAGSFRMGPGRSRSASHDST